LVGLYSNEGSYLGSSQPINLGLGCEDLGVAAHELGHALGMWHEMSRSDRDEWVKIQDNNVKEGVLHNFETKSTADVSSVFDFLSLMMYGSYAFSTNGNLTIEPHDLRLTNYMGQRMGFSELDIELIGTMYGCKDTVTPLDLNKHLSEEYLKNGVDLGFSGDCVDAAVTGYARSDGSDMPCSELKSFCSHDTQGPAIQKLCPVSCYMCTPGEGHLEPVDLGRANSRREFVSFLFSALTAILALCASA
jgi:hypothetical protein